jgi:hypothetical protein
MTAEAGVKNINQRRARQGRVTPGDARGFPVTLSQPGSYRLTSNLTLPPDEGTVGIEVTAQGVEIDLNGFAIIGPRVCPDPNEFLGCTPAVEDPTYTLISGGDNVTVRNGTARGSLGTGIWLGAHARIEDVNVLWNSKIAILAGLGSTVEDSLAAQSEQGILIGDDCTVTDNRIRANPFFGLQMTGPNCGYSGNVIACTPAFVCVSGGLQTGGNLCNGVVCP